MNEKSPQNPVFAVNPCMLDACLPKVVCPNCGTIICLRVNRPVKKVRCPGCDVAMTIRETDGEFTAEEVVKE